MANASTKKPRIRVRDAGLADLDNILDIHYSAFSSSVMDKLLEPNGISPSARAKFGATFFPEAAASDVTTPGPGPDGRHPRKGERIIKVAELLANEADEDGEVVAFGSWTLHREPREEWEWNVETLSSAEDLGEGVSVEVTNVFLGGLKRKQREHAQGEAYLALNILATEPKHWGLGAGSALVRWGLQLADQLGLPVFLEASPQGYPVYRRLGFEDIDVLDLNLRELWNVEYDGTDWGANSAVELAGPLAEGTHRSAIMKRPARQA
ncbi:hypothetical protein GQ53DRAFT_743373 [Thozetella sp. PMI_491]|nr:hypothetical protein GQ53DRAFT_743373 [Thozetella sp. PMI_491]